jgi:hypothetical protein
VGPSCLDHKKMPRRTGGVSCLLSEENAATREHRLGSRISSEQNCHPTRYTSGVSREACYRGDAKAIRRLNSAGAFPSWGRSRDWLKMKNPACAAVRLEAEEDCCTNHVHDALLTRAFIVTSPISSLTNSSRAAKLRNGVPSTHQGNRGRRRRRAPRKLRHEDGMTCGLRVPKATRLHLNFCALSREAGRRDASACQDAWHSGRGRPSLGDRMSDPAPGGPAERGSFWGRFCRSEPS